MDNLTGFCASGSRNHIKQVFIAAFLGEESLAKGVIRDNLGLYGIFKEGSKDSLGNFFMGWR